MEKSLEKFLEELHEESQVEFIEFITIIISTTKKKLFLHVILNLKRLFDKKNTQLHNYTEIRILTFIMHTLELLKIGSLF